MHQKFCRLLQVQDHLDRKDITKKVSMCKWYNAFKIVEMATEMEMAKDFTYHLVQDHLDRKDITKKVSMCKWYNAELSNRVAYHCVQLHGGYGYMDEYQISRDALDMRMGSIAAGTTEVMKMIIARLMGL